ncbi:hypothetical protein LXA43DRAFT_200951 [Ganoderma leucocontextum]|nr:hypothetical protein LXA43DRAFT_200951 [Ganoderma leucocontextum]
MKSNQFETYLRPRWRPAAAVPNATKAWCQSANSMNMISVPVQNQPLPSMASVGRAMERARIFKTSSTSASPANGMLHLRKRHHVFDLNRSLSATSTAPHLLLAAIAITSTKLGPVGECGVEAGSLEVRELGGNSQTDTKADGNNNARTRRTRHGSLQSIARIQGSIVRLSCVMSFRKYVTIPGRWSWKTRILRVRHGATCSRGIRMEVARPTTYAKLGGNNRGMAAA